MQFWRERSIRSLFCEHLLLPVSVLGSSCLHVSEMKPYHQQMPMMAVCAGTWTMNRMHQRLQSALLVRIHQTR